MSKSAAASPFEKHHFLLTVLLLNAWTADGLQNTSGVQVRSDLQVNNELLTAKEGSSILIGSNLTGSHDGVEWYNSRGRLKGEDHTHWLKKKLCEL